MLTLFLLFLILHDDSETSTETKMKREVCVNRVAMILALKLNSPLLMWLKLIVEMENNLTYNVPKRQQTKSKELTFKLLAGIPSRSISSSSSSLIKYGRRLYARSSSHTSIGEKVVRCRFFLGGCSECVDT